MSSTLPRSSLEKAILAALLILVLLLLIPYAGFFLSHNSSSEKKNAGNRRGPELQRSAPAFEAGDSRFQPAELRANPVEKVRKLDDIELMLGPSRYSEENEQ